MGEVGALARLVLNTSSQDSFPAQGLTSFWEKISDIAPSNNSFVHITCQCTAVSGVANLLGELEPLSLDFFAICLEEAV